MKNKKTLFAVVGLLLAASVLAFVFITRGNTAGKDKAVNSVTVQKDGNTLTVSRDGSVRYEKDGELYEDYWDSGKVKTFFDYIDKNYSGEPQIISGGQNYISINSGSGSSTYILDGDELIDTVEKETGGGSGGNGSGSGGGSSTVNPTPTSTPTSGSGGGTGGGGGGSSSECLYWRLSYCVRPRTSTPSPTSTPVTVEIREPNCEDNTQTGKTVIGNELCLPTPTPTP